MRTLSAICPRCRSDVDTGIAADQEMMRQLGPKLSVLILCDNCRKYHKMMVEDLYFAANVSELAA